MKTRIAVSWIGAAVFLSGAAEALAAEARPFDRTEDIVYGRKHGVALTMDAFTPKPSSGAAVVFVVSGGWFSSHDAINPSLFQELLNRGATVFAVVHGSQPKFAIPEIVEDLHRAVRYIRCSAARYAIDPARIGIMGASAGGHLSLMIATSGKPGASDAKDPVDRESSRVQAVACFFPPTDFLNYGGEGRDVFKALEEELASFKAPFDFRELDRKTGQLALIGDPAKRLEIARDISPITHVSSDDPPTLIFHGDADKLVPYQQAQAMEKRLREAGVTVKLVTRPGAGHGWPEFPKDLAAIADWFDAHLAKPESKKSGDS